MFIDSKGMQVGGLNLAGEHKEKGGQHPAPPRRTTMLINFATLTAKRKDMREAGNRQDLFPSVVLLEGAVRPASRRNGWHPESK